MKEHRVKYLLKLPKEIRRFWTGRLSKMQKT